MQIIFFTEQNPDDFKPESAHSRYPAAPEKCPFKDCGNPQEMQKHGFYNRYLITRDFTGLIRIRRYKCRVCGRTVSMLPAFCLPQFIYGLELIVELMRTAMENESVRRAAKVFGRTITGISRRHITFYLSRLRQNRRLINYGLKQLSPGGVFEDGPPGDKEWTRKILSGTRPTLCPESNARFHKETGHNFMSTRIMIS